MNMKDKVFEGKADVKVSVIVLTHNNLPLTIECIDSILATRPSGMELDLIIHDNGSTDGTKEWLNHLGFNKKQEDVTIKTLLSPTNMGFGAGMNQAYRAAEGDIIVFLNNDTVVTPD